MKGHKITILLILVIFMVIGCVNNNQSRKIENIKAFAKLYGYVRWFHPSDEAQKIDWEQFACYGSQMVENAPNAIALKDSLLKLFLPIAPSLQIHAGSNKNIMDTSLVIDDNVNNLYPVYWQHSGVKLNKTPDNVYKSLRINRIFKSDFEKIPAFSKNIVVSELKGKTVELEVNVKSENGSTGYIFFEGLNKQEYMNVTGNIDLSPFSNSNWEKVTIQRRIDFEDDYLIIGFNTLGIANVFINDVKIIVKNKDKDSVLFENNLDGLQRDILNDFYIGNNLPFNIQRTAGKSATDSCLSINYTEHFKLFDDSLNIGEIINEKIHKDLVINLPLVLPANDDHTFPVAVNGVLKKFQSDLTIYNPSPDAKNIASLIITWNIIQHFFPYFGEIDFNWENELDVIFKDFYRETDTHVILQKLTAKLHDGHVFVSDNQYKKQNYLPIKWDWIGEKLVITDVYDQSLGLKPGFVITKMNGQKPKLFFSEVEKTISAGTEGWLKHTSLAKILWGDPGKTLDLKIEDGEGKSRSVQLSYSMGIRNYYSKSANLARYKKLENHIIYLNLDQIRESEIDSLLPTIIESKGIICDLRGYPKNNFKFLKHLMRQQDTVGDWIKIPEIIFPNHKNTVGYSYPNRNRWMIPENLRIDTPVVFITDGRAISAAETYLMIVKYYKLATIIGQPTAGTNGMVNAFELPNGMTVRFTGAKVVNFDGSRHFGIGVLPDVYVKRTIDGVKAGKDEFLEKAMEILAYQINNLN